MKQISGQTKEERDLSLTDFICDQLHHLPDSNPIPDFFEEVEPNDKELNEIFDLVRQMEKEREEDERNEPLGTIGASWPNQSNDERKEQAGSGVHV